MVKIYIDTMNHVGVDYKCDRQTGRQTDKQTDRTTFSNMRALTALDAG